MSCILEKKKGKKFVVKTKLCGIYRCFSFEQGIRILCVVKKKMFWLLCVVNNSLTSLIDFPVEESFRTSFIALAVKC